MTRRELLYFIFRWKSTVIGWTLFITGLVVLLVFMKSPDYQTGSKVLVERTKAPVLVADIYTVPEMVEAMNTEIGIALSRPVLEDVIDRLQLDRPAAGTEDAAAEPGLMERLGLTTRLPPREAWVSHLAGSLEVEAVVDSNILLIRYTDSDPEMAARIVNAATDAYMAHRLQVYSTPGAAEYFRARMEGASAELDRLRQELATFKEERSLTAIDERRTEIVRELTVLRGQVTAARQELTDISTRFAANHPRALAAQMNIDALEAEIANRDRELDDLERWAATVDDLEARIASHQELVLDYQNRLEQQQAQEGATEDLVNVRVVQYAAVPVQPRLSRLTAIKFGIVGAFLLALLLALVRQYFDRRVSDPETAERALGVPVIGSLPKVKAAA